MPTGQFSYLQEQIVPQAAGFPAVPSYTKMHLTFSKTFSSHDFFQFFYLEGGNQ